MAVELYKVQTPVVYTRTYTVLVYNQDRSFYTELEGELAEALAMGLGMQRMGDRVYVRGVVKDNHFHVDRDTVTRKDQGW